MSRCTARSETGAQCLLSGVGHLDHYSLGGVAWPNEEARQARERAPKKTSGSKARVETQKELRQMASRATPFARVNPISDTTPTVPAEQWPAHAAQVLHRLLLTRAEPFTTPEVLWPLLDSPEGDMRALSVIIQAALREGKMAEVGFLRLRDTYRTKDGVEFRINKVVPRYRSLIYFSA